MRDFYIYGMMYEKTIVELMIQLIDPVNRTYAMVVERFRLHQFVVERFGLHQFVVERFRLHQIVLFRVNFTLPSIHLHCISLRGCQSTVDFLFIFKICKSPHFYETSALHKVIGLTIILWGMSKQIRIYKYISVTGVSKLT